MKIKKVFFPLSHMLHIKPVKPDKVLGIHGQTRRLVEGNGYFPDETIRRADLQLRDILLYAFKYGRTDALLCTIEVLAPQLLVAEHWRLYASDKIERRKFSDLVSWFQKEFNTQCLFSLDTTQDKGSYVLIRFFIKDKKTNVKSLVRTK